MSLKKLLIEIDKCLKKVTEGLQHFDQIYDKISQCANQSQRDKLEQDLKKEIKKLQRNRDQIKLYLQKDEIKDKRQLEENKRLIETQMERFKAMERELKLKAFSKEGLAQQVVDPKEKEKNEAMDWISEQLSQFESNIEKFEYEIEQLEGNKKMKNKNKDKVEELDAYIERHKYHQMQLEILLRMLENGKITPPEIEDIKDSVVYYLENYEDEDGMDEGIYDDFDLDQQEDLFGMLPEKTEITPGTTPTSTPLRTPSLKREDADLIVPKPHIVPVNSPDSPKKELKSINTILSVESPGKVSPLQTAQVHSPQLKGFADMLKDDKKERPLPGQTPAVSTNTTPVLNFRAAIKTSAPPGMSSKASETSKSKKEASALPAQEVSVPLAFEDLLASFNHAKNTAFNRSLEETAALFEASLKYIPTSHDIIPTQPYFPKNAHPVPSYFPQMPLALFDNPITFQKLNSETLFFAFYCQQKTLQQYLAARELKKQSWRFHTKEKLWFQRHQEPKEIQESFEVGTYMTFDPFDEWTQKKRIDFMFEYKFLEDTEMP